MNSEGNNKDELTRKAKLYSSIKYSLTAVDLVYSLILLLAFSASGISVILARQVSHLITARFWVIAVYFFIVYGAYYLLDFPLNFYRSFILEHKFALSTQKIGGWLKDQFKAGIISYLLGIITIEAFYYILRAYPGIWWLVISLFWIFFSLILAKLAPVIIIPLFFKYKKLSDNILRERIVNLSDKIGVKILDVFEIDFSKKTLKANAAFVGWGKTRRIILADTLKDKYGYEEIEVILAHEFAHYKLGHLLKLISLNAAGTVLSFYLMFKTSGFVLGFFGLPALSDIASFPVIAMYLAVFGIITGPLQNYLSRRMEKNADRMALEVTGLKEAFISMMEKLAQQNLADRSPRPLIKFFFFDHPPVDERIALAKSITP